MLKSYKYRIYPDEKQQINISKTFGCVRFVYNQVLTEKIIEYRKTGNVSSYCLEDFQSNYNWSENIDDKALEKAFIDATDTIHKFLKQQPDTNKNLKYRRKKNTRQSYSTTNENVKVGDYSLYLPKIGVIKMQKHRQIPNCYKIKSVTIIKNRTDKFFVSINCTCNDVIKPIKAKTFIGMDFSTNELVIRSDDKPVNYIYLLNKYSKKLKIENEKLKQKTHDSNNWHKQRLKYAKVHEKIVNTRKDFLHKLSRQIANDYDCVCIETLKLKEMTIQDKKKIYDTSFGNFVHMLKYKLAWQGKHLIKVPADFASTQTCSRCDTQKDKANYLKKEDRTYECHVCNLKLDRDVNASINILRKGKKLYENPPTAGHAGTVSANSP